MTLHFLFKGETIKRQYKSMPLGLLSFFVALVGVACSQQGNPAIGAITSLNITDSAGVPVSTTLNISNTNYVCVLGSYTYHVNDDYSFSSRINSYLDNQDKKLSFYTDGSWILVYGDDTTIFVEHAGRRQLELMAIKKSDDEAVSSICGFASTIMIIKLVEGKVAFKLEEKK